VSDEVSDPPLGLDDPPSVGLDRDTAPAGHRPLAGVSAALPARERSSALSPPKATDVIRRKLDAGTLPSRIQGSVYVGYGNGRRCDGCDTRITSAQIEHEFDAADGRVVRFHIGCASLWLAALLRLGINPQAD
jgi:hypothetical protein